jgi:hypothetical protein
VDSSLPQGLVLADHQSRAFHGQLFSIAADGVITDATTQRVLDCTEAKRGSHVALANRSGSCTQRWSICADGSVRLQDAALCLDVRGGKMTALSPLIVWAPHGKANQRFRIVSGFAHAISAVLLTRCCNQVAAPLSPPAQPCARAGCNFAVHTAQQSQGNTSHCCLQCKSDGSHSISCQRAPAAPLAPVSSLIQQLLQSAPSAPSAEPECQICMAEAATFAAIPCGHRVLCSGCKLDTQLPECPVCRTAVTSFIRIY